MPPLMLNDKEHHHHHHHHKHHKHQHGEASPSTSTSEGHVSAPVSPAFLADAVKSNVSIFLGYLSMPTEKRYAFFAKPFYSLADKSVNIFVV